MKTNKILEARRYVLAVATFISLTTAGHALANNARRATLDGSENIYSTENVGGGSLIVSAGDRTRTIKRNANGTLLWAADYTYDKTGYNFPVQVAVDSSGNVYVAGQARLNASGELQFGYLLKYNASGTLQWHKETTKNGQTVTGLVIDGSGNPCFTAYYSSSGYVNKIYRYSPAGTQLNNKTLTVSANAKVEFIKYSSTAGLVVSGEVRDPASTTYATTSLVARCQTDTNLTQVWAISEPLDATAVNTGLAVDGAGNPVTSYANARVNYGAAYVKKNALTNGSSVWSTDVSQGLFYRVNGGLIIDSNGDVVIAGDQDATTTSPTTSNCRVVKLSGSSGSVQWSNTDSNAAFNTAGLIEDAGGNYIALCERNPLLDNNYQIYNPVYSTSGTQLGAYSLLVDFRRTDGFSILPTNSSALTFYIEGRVYQDAVDPALSPSSVQQNSYMLNAKMYSGTPLWYFWFGAL